MIKAIKRFTMNAFHTFLIVLLIMVAVVLCYFEFKLYFLKKPTPGSSCSGAFSSDCSTINETTPDESLISPTGKSLELISFTNDVNFPGLPFYQPVWYRFRYVNGTTGGYSGWSDWCSHPIQSGGCCFPCTDCGNIAGVNSCQNNKLTVGIPISNLDYTLETLVGNGDVVYAVVHSYLGNVNEVTPPSSPTNDTIVGYLIPGSLVNGIQYYSVLDTTNPCQKCIQTSCMSNSSDSCSTTTC